MEFQLRRGGRIRAADRHWGAIAIMVVAAVVLGGASAAIGHQFTHRSVPARPLAGVTTVHAQPIPSVGPGTDVSPAAVPDHMLLQVPFTTQAPLNNWAQHQESCEAANLTMLYLYWKHDQSVVIDPRAADNFIRQIDSWKSQPDLNDTMTGQLAQQHWGFTYRLLPNDPDVIAQQLSAGRPLLAEVRTHGLGNSHYPGYSSHYEQAGWSVPHFILIIGYDSTGVWINDPGISLGRGYHISYGQLWHAIDDLDEHHPALNEGEVLLLVGPEASVR